MTKKLLGIILIIVLVASLCGSIFAADIVPAPPTLKLTVEMSPLTVWPPIMIFTAQLSYMPPVTTTVPMCDFFNGPVDSTSTYPPYLGSAPFDKTGKAVLSKPIKPGAYVAYVQTKLNNFLIVSNKVAYKIP